jgi:hypothetical protein
MLHKRKSLPEGCVIFFYLGAFGLAPAAMGQTYVFFDLPNTYYTYPLSINANGAVTGFATFGGTRLAFIRDAAGTITTFSAGSGFTVPRSINDSGAITGTVGKRGFVRASDGTITLFDPIPSVNTLPQHINAAGSITGYYFDAQGSGHGFVRSPNGITITILTPTNVGVFPRKINAGSDVVGYSTSPANGARGFVFDLSGGIFTDLLVSPGAIATEATDINDNHMIIGWYQQPQGMRFIGFVIDAGGVATSFSPDFHTKPLSINTEGGITGSTGDILLGHGFVRSPNGTVTVFDAPGCLATHGVSINDQGVIAGWCDKGFRGLAFLRYP